MPAALGDTSAAFAGADSSTTTTVTIATTTAAVPRHPPPAKKCAVAGGDDVNLLDLPDDCLRQVIVALWATSGASAAPTVGRVCRRLRRLVNEARREVTLQWCVGCGAAVAPAAAMTAAATAAAPSTVTAMVSEGRRGGQARAAAAVAARGSPHLSLATSLLDAVALLRRHGGLQHVTLLDAVDPPGLEGEDPIGEAPQACSAPPTARAAVWRAVGDALRGSPRLSRLTVSGTAVAAVGPAVAAGGAPCLTALDYLLVGGVGQPLLPGLEARLCTNLAVVAPTLRSLTLSAMGGWPDGTLAALFHRIGGGFPTLTTLSIGLGGGAIRTADAGALAATCPAVEDVAFCDGLTVSAGDELRLSRGAWPSLLHVTAAVDWNEGGGGRPIGGLPGLLAGRSLRRVAIDGGGGGRGGVGSMGWGEDVWFRSPLRRLNGVVAALLGCQRLPSSVAVEGVTLDPVDWAAFTNTHRTMTDVTSLSLPRRDCAATIVPGLSDMYQLRSLSLGLNVCGIPVSFFCPSTWTLPPALADLTCHLHDGGRRAFADNGRWRSVVWAVTTAAAASRCGTNTLSRLAVVADGGCLHPQPFEPLVRCTALRTLAVHSRDARDGEVAKLELHLPPLLPRVTVSVTAGEVGRP
ncbi:hypothetical protein MMPV_002103 [Pyropia vietnamensis]